MLGTAKVMSYEDLEEAKAKRAEQKEKKAKKGKRGGGGKRNNKSPKPHDFPTDLGAETCAKGRIRTTVHSNWLNHIAPSAVRSRRALEEQRSRGCGNFEATMMRSALCRCFGGTQTGYKLLSTFHRRRGVVNLV